MEIFSGLKLQTWTYFTFLVIHVILYSPRHIWIPQWLLFLLDWFPLRTSVFERKKPLCLSMFMSVYVPLKCSDKQKCGVLQFKEPFIPSPLIQTTKTVCVWRCVCVYVFLSLFLTQVSEEEASQLKLSPLSRPFFPHIVRSTCMFASVCECVCSMRLQLRQCCQFLRQQRAPPICTSPARFLSVSIKHALLSLRHSQPERCRSTAQHLHPLLVQANYCR